MQGNHSGMDSVEGTAGMILLHRLIGSCKNCFDENGQSLIPNFVDVSDFAVALENAVEITKEEFNKAILPRDVWPWFGHKVRYLYNSSHSVIMVHDETDDVHYFFSE